jgi:hypothetical protein
VPYPCLFIYGTCHGHIMDTSLCLHICLCIEYNHSEMCGMLCTQHPLFSTFSLLLRNYWEINYLSEIPHL